MRFGWGILWMAGLAFIAGFFPRAFAQADPKSSSFPGLPEIVSKMDSSNRARAEALQRFEGTRTYTMRYHGFPSGQAEIVVAVRYQAPATKSFRIVSQSGSKLIVDHVFKPMLESERQGASDPTRVEISSQNYRFSLDGIEHTPHGDEYVLAATPRRNDHFLFRGRVWVDSRDFAVVKIEGEPAESPSFWIKHTEIHHLYKKVGDFWLPAENHSTSYMRLGGRADLSIEYQKYDITQAEPLPATNVQIGGENSRLNTTRY